MGSYLNPTHLPKSTPVVSLFDIAYETKMAVICLERDRLWGNGGVSSRFGRKDDRQSRGKSERIHLKDGGNMINVIAIVVQRNGCILKIRIATNSKCIRSLKLS